MPVACLRSIRRICLVTGALGAALVTGTCRAAGPALADAPNGESAARTATAADALFESMRLRFTSVRRSRKFSHARIRIGRHALSPSGIWNDTLVWNARTLTTRTLSVAGGFQNGSYFFTDRVAAPQPTELAASRHTMHLRRVAEGQFEWLATVDHAVGSVRAAQMSDLLEASLRGVTAIAHPVPVEGSAQPATTVRPRTVSIATARAAELLLRANYRGAFPRTTASLGRLVTLDTIRITPLSDGSASLLLGMRLRPQGIRATHPALAKYVTDYIVPTVFRLTLTDRAGTRWFDAAARDGFMRVRVRTRDGRLMSLDGAARTMPDSLLIRSEFITKILIFNVGYTNLVGDFALVRGEHERGWHMRFRREPEWQLPLAARHLIRAPLRHPFERDGSLLRIVMRDTAGSQTTLAREVRLAVQESAIVRWLGRLGFTAMSDFVGKSEADENRFNVEVFTALGADFRALIAELGPAEASIK